MSMIYDGTSITFPDNSQQKTAAKVGMVNRIINGAMMIDQRNAGASVTTGSGYSLDRWQLNSSQSSKFTVQQNAGSVTPPAGFTKYLGVTSSSAYSLGAGDYFNLDHHIEGLNVADLAWGTAGAQPVTLSFWVRSSLTGVFGGSITNNLFNRSYPYTYNINSANTWEYKTVTIAGDTTGTWAVDNTTGMNVLFGLGVGSTYSGTAGAWAGTNYNSATGATSVVGTSGATFYITGVQLEKGSTATSFDYRPYGQELALCQRYYAKLKNDGVGQNVALCSGRQQTTTVSHIIAIFPSSMRAEPTFSYANINVTDQSNYTTAMTGISGVYAGYNTAMLMVSHAAVGAQNVSVFLTIADNTSGYIDMNAEL